MKLTLNIVDAIAHDLLLLAVFWRSFFPCGFLTFSTGDKDRRRESGERAFSTLYWKFIFSRSSLSCWENLSARMR